MAAVEKMRADGKQRLGHPGFHFFVVPLTLARRELLKHTTELSAMAENDSSYSRIGEREGAWRTYLARQIALKRGISETSAYRRIWSVMNSNKSIVIDADWMEAALIACGLLLDQDTDLPTLPGNPRLAHEMAEAYAEFHAPDIDVDALAAELWEFTKAVFRHPWHENETWGDEAYVPDEVVLSMNNAEFLEQIKEVTKWPK
jgi:hypothetical protein